MLVQPRLQVPRRRVVVRSPIAGVRGPGRIGSEIRRSRIYLPPGVMRHEALRCRYRAPGWRKRLGLRLVGTVLRRSRMRLRSRRRPALILLPRRVRLVLPGHVRRLRRMRWLRMRLGSGMRRRRRRRVLLILPKGERGKQPDYAHRGSQSCAAPHVRLAYAFHVHPN